MNQSISINTYYLALFTLLLLAIVLSVTPFIGRLPFLLLFLGCLSIFAIPFPVIIPVTVLFFAPLLGRPGDLQYWPVDSMALIGGWLLLMGGTYLISNLDKIVRNKIFLILLTLLLLEILSIIYSTNRLISITEMLRWASIVLFFVLVCMLSKNSINRKIIFLTILVSAIIPLVVGLYQKFTGDFELRAGDRLSLYELETDIMFIYGTFWSFHPFAKYLVIISSLLFAGILLKKRLEFIKILMMTIFCVAFLELIFTYARSQLIGFVISAIIILYALGKLKLQKILIYSPLILFGLFVLFDYMGVFDRFSDLVQVPDLHTKVLENTLESRLVLWIQGFPLALHRPFFGHGADMFGNNLVMVAHNDYLELFYNLGFAGPLLYLMLLIVCIKTAWKKRKLPALWYDKSFIVAASGIGVAILIVSTVENMFRDTVMWWFYFAIVGCMLNVPNKEIITTRINVK